MFEINSGDDNDNYISEGFIEAQSKAAAFDKINKLIQERLEDNQIVWKDGDETSISLLYYGKDNCSEGSECSIERCSSDHRTFHHDFRLVREELTEPTKASSNWRGWEGRIY
jgi:hypothetical protein